MLAFFRRQNGRAFFPPLPIAALPRRSWRGTYSTPAGWDVTVRPDFFARQKASVKSNPRWLFYASHEALRRMAVFSIQLTGGRAKPASREACRRAAVKPRPSCMSPYAPARLWRAGLLEGKRLNRKVTAIRRRASWLATKLSVDSTPHWAFSYKKADIFSSMSAFFIIKKQVTSKHPKLQGMARPLVN